MSRRKEIRVLEGTRCEVGEGILWCPRRRVLFWVDIKGRALLRLDPSTEALTRWPLPDQPGCIALTATDTLVVAMPDGLHLFDPATGSLAPNALLPPEAAAEHRANDGATSRGGLFHFGTMTLGDRSVASGALYHWSGEAGASQLARHFGGLHIVNGLAFSPDDRTAYVADSYESLRCIWRFDHEPETGAFTNRSLFFETAGRAGRPDGACVDADGCYWMAGVGGGELLRITPAGQVDLCIDLQVTWPTKPCFGGPDLRTLYLTSLDPSSSESGPDGAVLAIETGHQGLPEPVCLLRG